MVYIDEAGNLWTFCYFGNTKVLKGVIWKDGTQDNFNFGSYVFKYSKRFKR